MAEALTKGVAVLHLADYVRETFGEEGFTKFAATLPPELRHRIEAPNATEWYSVAGHAETIKRLADHFWGGDYAKADVLGVHNLQKSLNGVYRLVVRVLNPEYLVRKSARLWSNFVDTGSLQVEQVGPRHLRIRLEGIRSPHPAWCISVGGSFVGALLACGAKDPKATKTACSTTGAPCCSFEVTWQ